MKVRVMVTDHIYPGSTNNPAHVYTREALEGAVERFNARREKRPEYGELHVSNLTLEVDLNHVSHEVVNLEMIDNEVVATIESVKTPLGVILDQLGDNAQFSLRVVQTPVSMSTYQGDHGPIRVQVVDKLEVITADAVLHTPHNRIGEAHGLIPFDRTRWFD